MNEEEKNRWHDKLWRNSLEVCSFEYRFFSLSHICNNTTRAMAFAHGWTVLCPLLRCLFETKREFSLNETEVGEEKTSKHCQQVPSFQIGPNLGDNVRQRDV